MENPLDSWPAEQPERPAEQPERPALASRPVGAEQPATECASDKEAPPSQEELDYYMHPFMRGR